MSDLTLQQLLAVSALVSRAEQACECGRLDQGTELNLREVIARTRSTFTTLPDRQACNENISEEDIDRYQDVIAQVLR